MQDGLEVGLACRNGQFTGQTAGLAPGAIQANLVVLPETHALDFLAFCQLNSRSCPGRRIHAADDARAGNPGGENHHAVS
ncbi:MAG: hypothetical protein PVH89_05485, partial [Gammaproteobacteria bacterium]